MFCCAHITKELIRLHWIAFTLVIRMKQGFWPHLGHFSAIFIIYSHKLYIFIYIHFCVLYFYNINQLPTWISFVFSWPFMVFIKYTTMYKVHMHAAAIRKLSFGFVYVGEMILLLMDYLPIHKNNKNLLSALAELTSTQQES